MKLIIDIPENFIECAKSSPNYYPTYHFEKIWRAIANGIPYEPKGDLISREALKKAIKDNGYSHYFEIFEIIDNAPTISTSLNLKNITEEDIEKFKIIWQRATSKSLTKFIEDRPKGEWVFDEKGNFYCDKCGKYPHDQYATTDFCPSCGALMNILKEKGGDLSGR